MSLVLLRLQQSALKEDSVTLLRWNPQSHHITLLDMLLAVDSIIDINGGVNYFGLPIALAVLQKFLDYVKIYETFVLL